MKVDYLDHMGSDLTVVNAARVSFNKESNWDAASLRLSEKDVKLINYLARNGHWTPFAQPQIALRLTVPLFVARQDFKHQIGFTRNEVSRRYVDDAPEFFVPDVWRSRPDASVKQGSGKAKIETVKIGYPPEDDKPADIHTVSLTALYKSVVNSAKHLYTAMVHNGVAPEQARMVLPQSMYTSYYVTASLAAWARAYKQRVDPHAQQEIRELYQEIGNIINPLFSVSWPVLTNTKDSK